MPARKVYQDDYYSSSSGNNASSSSSSAPSTSFGTSASGLGGTAKLDPESAKPRQNKAQSYQPSSQSQSKPASSSGSTARRVYGNPEPVRTTPQTQSSQPKAGNGPSKDDTIKPRKRAVPIGKQEKRPTRVTPSAKKQLSTGRILSIIAVGISIGALFLAFQPGYNIATPILVVAALVVGFVGMGMIRKSGLGKIFVASLSIVLSLASLLLSFGVNAFLLSQRVGGIQQGAQQAFELVGKVVSGEASLSAVSEFLTQPVLDTGNASGEPAPFFPEQQQPTEAQPPAEQQPPEAAMPEQQPTPEQQPAPEQQPVEQQPAEPQPPVQ